MTHRILIVEDEPLISFLVEEMVAELGWEVVASVQTQEDGLSLLASHAPSLALLDIRLFTTSSLELADECQRRHIPVIFMTGYSGEDVPAECSGSPVLYKPFSTIDLQAAVETAFSSLHNPTDD